MSAAKVLAIGLIFVAACGGWAILGTATELRSTEYTGRLGAKVEQLWGSSLIQEAPSFGAVIPGNDQLRWVMPVQNEIKVSLRTDYRKKGLIWYPTYTSGFDGTYIIQNDNDVGQKVRLHFGFPTKDGTYDKFSVWIDGEKLQAPVNTAEGVNEIIELAPGQQGTFRATYETRGMTEWRYRLDPNAGRVQNLNLIVDTNFASVDYPDDCLSPMSTQTAADGLTLTWQASDLITREDVGVLIPERINPGPLTTRITFFAPVCLLFFFVLVASINILYKINIHPMHYLFVAAGFFAFHLLLSYMAGVVNIHVAFVVSALVSVVLVTSYLTAALKGRLPWKVAAAGQLFYLVLFSYTFFLKGVTGLIVAIGSVLTLAVLMKLTAHIDWDTVFVKRKKSEPTPPPLPDANVAQG